MLDIRVFFLSPVINMDKVNGNVLTTRLKFIFTLFTVLLVIAYP